LLKKNNMTKLPKIITPDYCFNYPIKLISNHKIKSFKSLNLLKQKPYFLNANQLRIDKIVQKINSAKIYLPWLLELIGQLAPNHKIITIFVYGSYIFGPNNYKPNDIDFGIIVSGGYFRYILSRKLPPFLNKKIKTADIFIYGLDNLEKGIPINDVVYGGVIHRQVIKHETAIAYWRNIVIYGYDFVKSNNLLYNTYTFIMVNLENVRERLARYGKCDSEDDKKCLMRVANRLYELNIFLNIFNSKSAYNLEQINSWPISARKGYISFSQLLDIYNSTLKTYQQIGNKIISKY